MNQLTYKAWRLGSTEGRWAGLGPYYAMFPVAFAKEMVEQYSAPGDTILDPFCGRGTSNYVAKTLGRHSFGTELNPVGWVFAKAKTDPAVRSADVIRRLEEIWEARLDSDHFAENEFQEWAWHPNVLAFLNSARRNLNWRKSKVDWTLAAIILVYLHAKLGGGLSNQMRQSKSMSPNYSVAWWKNKQFNPPEIDPVKYLRGRIEWRYSKGIVRNDCKTRIILGPAQTSIPKSPILEASLLLTSPPYMGVTDYRYDNWIRLWALGGPALPYGTGQENQRYADREAYSDMLFSVFSRAKLQLREDATVIVRTDRRRYTLETTVFTLNDLWPFSKIYGRSAKVLGRTQTQLFGDTGKKPGEVDLVLLPNSVNPPAGYVDLQALGDRLLERDRMAGSVV